MGAKAAILDASRRRPYTCAIMLQPHHRQYAAAYLMDFAMITAFTAMPFFIFDQLGGGARMSGVIAAFQSICYAGACLATTRWISQGGRPLRWAMAGQVGFVILVPSAVFAGSPAVFAVITLLGLSCIALFWPAMQAWIGGEPDPKIRTRRIGFYNVAWTLGLATGPLVAGPAYDYDYRLPFVIIVCAASLALAFVATLPAEQPPARRKGQPSDAPPPERPPDPLSEQQLYAAWCANFVSWAMIGVMRSVFPKRVDDLYQAGDLIFWAEPLRMEGALTLQAATQFSWLAFVLYFSRTALSLAMGYTTWWHHRFGLLIVLQIAASAAFMVLGAAHSLVIMLACCAVVGVASGACFFASIYNSVANPKLKHKRAAIHESMVGIGSFTGSMGFGLLAGWMGASGPFLLTPLFVAAAIGVQWALLRAGRRKGGDLP